MVNKIFKAFIRLNWSLFCDPLPGWLVLFVMWIVFPGIALLELDHRFLGFRARLTAEALAARQREEKELADAHALFVSRERQWPIQMQKGLQELAKSRGQENVLSPELSEGFETGFYHAIARVAEPERFAKLYANHETLLSRSGTQKRLMLRETNKKLLKELALRIPNGLGVGEGVFLHSPAPKLFWQQSPNSKVADEPWVESHKKADDYKEGLERGKAYVANTLSDAVNTARTGIRVLPSKDQPQPRSVKELEP